MSSEKGNERANEKSQKRSAKGEVCSSCARTLQKEKVLFFNLLKTKAKLCFVVILLVGPPVWLLYILNVNAKLIEESALGQILPQVRLSAVPCKNTNAIFVTFCSPNFNIS